MSSQIHLWCSRRAALPQRTFNQGKQTLFVFCTVAPAKWADERQARGKSNEVEVI